MRTVTKAEAEQNLTAILDVAVLEPVRIQQPGQDVILVSATEFEEAQRVLHAKRMSALHEIRERASKEAKDNGFTEDMLPDLLA
jgi:PHD/YefM family antitoxin component YafN of YafNO toxin-antitoxin module